MVQRFYWVIDGQLAGSSRPGAHGSSITGDLAILRGYGIQSVLTLTETPVLAHELEAAGLDTLHIPVDDFFAPTTQQMLQSLAYIDASLAENMPVVVHCLAGQGRTGTILAAWLLRSGLSADDAIADIRALAPGAIESAPQVAALRRWADERPWLV